MQRIVAKQSKHIKVRTSIEGDIFIALCCYSLSMIRFTEEVDNLTRRCKSAETSFSSLTQSLGENPDPYKVLSSVLNLVNTQQLQLSNLSRAIEELEADKVALEQGSSKNDTSKQESSSLTKAEKEELIQLRREVAEYEVEFRSLKNQDITIRKLEARILELQTGGEEEFQSKLEKAREELAETEGRRTAEALEREAAMERKVQTLELQLKAEMAGRAATQAHLLEASEGVGEREAAWEAQRRILVDDAERLRLNLHEATRERDELRLKVGALEGGKSMQSAPSSGGIQIADLLSEREAYEAEVSELSHTVNLLREEIAIKDEIFSDERRSLQSKIDSLESQVQSTKATLSSLQDQLAEAPSQSLIDNMKRELRILKLLEYNADDPDLVDRDPEMTGSGEGHEKDLESVLVAKLRRVESELVKERNQKTEISQVYEQLRGELHVLESAKIEAEKVIASLEADLDKAISKSSVTQSSHAVVRKSLPDVESSSTATLQNVLDPSSPSTDFQDDKKIEASAAEKAADDHSVATIIMAQRDRLRARCDALEAERDSFKRELQAQVDAAESLKTDNTKLYEKMRYLQSYKGNAGSRGAYARSTSRDLDLEALEQRYEASVDPFRQFSRAERQRKLNEMSPMERTVFVVAKTMLGSKEMRTFLFFYVFAMHFLVFLTTYHWSHSEGGSGCSIQDIEHLAHLPPMTIKTPDEVIKDMSGK